MEGADRQPLRPGGGHPDHLAGAETAADEPPARNHALPALAGRVPPVVRHAPNVISGPQARPVSYEFIDHRPTPFDGIGRGLRRHVGHEVREMCEDSARRKSGASKISPAEATPTVLVCPVKMR
jgi:hypothetical protein